MTHSDLYSQLLLASAVAAGLLTWTLATTLLAPRAWFWRALVAVVSGFATVGVLISMGHPISTSWWIAISSVVFLLVPLTSTKLWLGLGHLIQSLSIRRHSRLFSLVAFVIIGIGWCLAYHHYEQSQFSLADAMNSQVEARIPPHVTPATVMGVTDLGQVIELGLPTNPADLSSLEELEESSAPIQQFQHHWMIRREPPDDNSNCHGWVFTGGKYNIGGQSVSTILEQNNYVKVNRPEVNDLVIYLGSAGDISHSGIVRAVLGKSDILVESKWGRMGVYLHPVDKSCYGLDYAFYRSERETHLINMRAGEAKKEGMME